jgi:predicted DNA binding CopG/RHH family protein
LKKTIPTFKTDKEAEDFVATADLSQYDLSGGQVMRFELKPKNASVNLRLSARNPHPDRHQQDQRDGRQQNQHLKALAQHHSQQEADHQ